MHPNDARDRDLQTGDRVQVTSRVGTIEVTLELTDDVMPGVVSLPHGWGHDRPGIRLPVAGAHAGVSANDLTDEQFIDQLSGNAALNGLAVTVTRIAAAA
jgi:anaerobic selenocysteine-containing dehydrogenase